MPGQLERVIRPSTRMDQKWYSFSAFPARKPFKWPGNASVALWVVPSVEFMELVPAAGTFGPMPSSTDAPNVRNWSHRDYGNRVGIWRIMDVLDKHSVRATAAVNASAAERYPLVVEESLKRGWEVMAHGEFASSWVTERLPLDDERALIARSRDAIARVTGAPPAGWLSPGLSESTRTPGLLAEAGFTYLADFVNDDQPFRMDVPSGRLTAVPYSIEVNDEVVIVQRNRTAWEFAQTAMDHFDAIYADAQAAGTGVVMCLPLHAYLTGQPLRIKYVDQILTHILGYDGVWPATGSEIASYHDTHC
ncbi:MAG TPA: polysaccharide deacetylase family protein [Dehalococcoidia bacterium]|nr:polysaccharide deacetylase family protein [Dehalococcoidia bacterium]